MTGSGAWYREGTVTVTNGNAVIVGVNTDWLTALIAVAIGDIFTVDSKTWYEIINVSTDTGITLDRNFEGGTSGGINYAIIRNTSGTVLTRIAGQVAVQFNQKQLFLDELRAWLNSTNATETVTDSHGVSTAITTPTQMASEHLARVNQVDTLVNGIAAMTKAEFFALAEQRKSTSAGSGFREWGKHWDNTTPNAPVNQGIYSDVSQPNILAIGRGDADTSQLGSSTTPYPSLVINGTSSIMKYINANVSSGRNFINFPSAPDGTKTHDSSTGTVTQHASAAIAFAAETATNKVITSRQDLVIIESWHEKISDKGVIYPLGNVQYGGTAYDGVALAINGIAQGYSAFGEWDNATTGNCAVWASLTDAQKATFIQNPENNIYSDNGELIQVRYRVRVVEGLGDAWLNTSHVSSQLGYALTSRVPIQGDSSVSPSWVGSGGSNHFYGASGVGERNKGEFTAFSGIGSAQNSHNGLCFAIPVALVQRRNQGAYHPAYNPDGASNLVNAAQTGNGKWYAANVQDNKPTSLGDCFEPSRFRPSYGDIANGGNNNGRPDAKFYDAIYASDVKDLRMSSVKKTANEIREKYKRKAIAGEVRGFEGVPFLVVKYSTNPVSTASTDAVYPDDAIANYAVGDIISLVNANGTVVFQNQYITVVGANFFRTKTSYARAVEVYKIMHHTTQTHSQANPTWTDIIGDPANIAAAFPDGVEGQWLPVIPDGTSKEYKGNRKAITDMQSLYTLDNGATWANSSVNFANTSNSFNTAANTGMVILVPYETQAHFTQDDVNSEVLDLGGVNGITANDGGRGNFLLSSLIDKVATGYVQQKYTLTVFGLTSSNMLDKGFWDGGKPTHSEIDLTNNSPAVKALDYLSSKNGVAKLCYAYKEMNFDVAWGDNNKFEITGNQNTMTDDNGNTVLYGTASFDTQYFISEE